jgi:hypothetical protein
MPINAIELIDILPESSLDELSLVSKLDYKVHELTGKRMFSLLLYGILETERLSLRTLADCFNSTKFKFFFKIDTSITKKAWRLLGN